MPSLRHWAATHDSLREIGRDNVLEVKAHATSGDIRALTDLFGLTAAGAMPYVISFSCAANDDVNRA